MPNHQKCQRLSVHFAWLSTVSYSFVSSANFSTFPEIELSRSFMYIMNTIQPRTDPWGTPLHTFLQLEQTPSRQTCYHRSDNQALVQLNNKPSMPWAFNLLRSRWWGTVSKALARSTTENPWCAGVTDVCPDCGVAPHSVEHLFQCPACPTQLTTQDLWDDPEAVADFLKLDDN